VARRCAVRAPVHLDGHAVRACVTPVRPRRGQGGHHDRRVVGGRLAPAAEGVARAARPAVRGSARPGRS
jgi:hypothetical protein